MKTIIPYCALLAAFGTGAAPLETAELRFARTDGTLSSESRRLVSMPDGARRLTVTVAEIARDVRALDVVLDAAVQPQDARGWWVIGDGRYGKMTRERGSLKSNRERMALFGMSVPSVTWCAVVKGLRLEYECHVDVRDGVYCVFPRFEIAGIEFDPYEDVVIDFYELKGRDANYSAMGRLYRSYQLGRGEVKPLRERIVGNPALAYATESIFLRCKFGRCDRRTSTRADWETNMPPVSVDYTFEDFRKIGFLAFAIAMFVGRTVGNALLARFSATAVFRFYVALTGLGMGASLLSPFLGLGAFAFLLVATVGFAIAGFGLSGLVPILYSNANRTTSMSPASAMTFVGSMGFLGYFFGPPMIGFLSHHTNLSIALAPFAVLILACLLLRLDGEPRQGN